MSVKWHFVGVVHEALEKENKVIKKKQAYELSKRNDR